MARSRARDLSKPRVSVVVQPMEERGGGSHTRRKSVLTADQNDGSSIRPVAARHPVTSSESMPRDPRATPGADIRGIASYSEVA